MEMFCANLYPCITIVLSGSALVSRIGGEAKRRQSAPLLVKLKKGFWNSNDILIECESVSPALIHFPVITWEAGVDNVDISEVSLIGRLLQSMPSKLCSGSFLLLCSLFIKGQILTRRRHNALQLAPVSPASLNMAHTWWISIYKLLLCQFWDSPFNRTWIYANVWSHYAFDSQPLQTVSFNGSFAIELHIVGCLIGSFDIYIASAAVLTGQSSIRLPILLRRLFHSAHLKLLTEPRRHYGLDCHIKPVMWASFLHEHILGALWHVLLSTTLMSWPVDPTERAFVFLTTDCAQEIEGNRVRH